MELIIKKRAIQKVLPLFKIPQFLTDACIAWQVEVVFDVFKVEPGKGTTMETAFLGGIVTFSSSHLLQSLDNQIWRHFFKEDKLSCLIVYFRSLAKKSIWDKQDFTVVEEHPPEATLIAKRWTN